MLRKADLGQQGQGCSQVSFSLSLRPRGCWRRQQMEAVLMLAEQGGAVLPPQGLIQNVPWSHCSMGPSPLASSSSSGASGQDLDLSILSILVSLLSTSGSPSPQHLGVPILNMHVSLFSASAASHPQHLGLPALNMLVFPFSTSRFPCPEPGRPLLPPPWRTSLHCFSFYLRLSGQGIMSQEGEEKVEERAASKPQDG